MRGLFSAGVMDVMMENDLHPHGVVGVSAGACFGCNYKSWQPGRAIRYNKEYAHDSRFCGLRSLITSGDIYNAEFAYHIMPNRLDKFDNATYLASPMEFHVVCTDVVTGRPVYRCCDDISGDRLFDWIRASASMPVVSRVVEIDGYRLLDGGMSDSIPLAYFESLGYDGCIVVLTQPRSYRKSPSKALPLIRMALRRYPHIIELMRTRHEMYNEQLRYVAEAEAAGRCMVISPEAPLPIGHISHSPAAMQQVYDLGRQAALRVLPRLTEYCAPQ